MQSYPNGFKMPPFCSFSNNMVWLKALHGKLITVNLDPSNILKQLRQCSEYILNHLYCRKLFTKLLRISFF